MHFQIRKLILWSKLGKPKRVVKFSSGRVNVISGASKTGKSAVIPIIDYCLGANKCSIPVGVIREACSWFGILIETAEGDKLLARREPGDQIQTGDMYVVEGTHIEIPEEIENANSNTASVKMMLDRVAGLPQLAFDPDGLTTFNYRPSFRDMMAFTFQPQNIIANPDVMFFKADTTEHREKLKTVFPFVLNAVTPEVLSARWEIDRLSRNLRKIEVELKAAVSSVDIWRAEASSWINHAKEIGLIPTDIAQPAEWPDVLDLLRRIQASNSRDARPSLDAIEGTLADLERLRDAEREAAAALSLSRQRLNEIRRLMDSSQSYGEAIRIQRDRLSVSEWISERYTRRRDALSQLSDFSIDDLHSLTSALRGIEIQIRSEPLLSNRMEKELARLRSEAEECIHRLSAVRSEIARLEDESESVKRAIFQSNRIERFLGRLEHALRVYERADDNSDLRDEALALRRKISELQATISEKEIQRRLNNALTAVEAHAASVIPKLDAEWPTAPIRLEIKDLTVRVIRGPRDDYLFEIGSGANWLAYHLALSLALQNFFLSSPHHPVPSFLVYDQPSQVYFPRRLADRSEDSEPKLVDEERALVLSDEDVIAVRKVFQALGDEVIRAKGRLQVIVLDHANDQVWGSIPGVELAQEWRGAEKLVPPDWVL